MTTLDLSQIKPIPGFDCVKMKRDIQAAIYEETKNMTPEEQRERLRKNSEEFWADIEHRRRKLAEQAALGQVIERADREYHKKFIQEAQEYTRQKRDAKERRDKEAENSAETARQIAGK